MNNEREELARILFIASDDFAFADRMARAWDAPGPHGRARWFRYADAVIAAGFHRTDTLREQVGVWACGKCGGTSYEHSLESSSCIWEPVPGYPGAYND